jgi:hypothetical protein
MVRTRNCDERIAPFRIAVPQAVLDDLAMRLARTRWTDDFANDGWAYVADKR